jgi:hypothetical protein
VLISFGLSILATCDLAKLLRGQGRQIAKWGKRWVVLLTGFVVALVLFEYLTLPFPTSRNEPSAFYYQLAQEDGDFAVAEVPIDRQFSKYSMYYQTIHEKKLVGGMVARTPTYAYDYIERNPLLYAAWQGGPQILDDSDVDRGMTMLADDDVRYLILHKDFLADDIVVSWRSLFKTQPFYEDAALLVYNTASAADENVAE